MSSHNHAASTEYSQHPCHIIIKKVSGENSQNCKVTKHVDTYSPHQLLIGERFEVTVTWNDFKYVFGCVKTILWTGHTSLAESRWQKPEVVMYYYQLVTLSSAKGWRWIWMWYNSFPPTGIFMNAILLYWMRSLLTRLGEKTKLLSIWKTSSSAYGFTWTFHSWRGKASKISFLSWLVKYRSLRKTLHKHVKRQALFVLTLNHLENHWILASISALRTIGESQS